MRILFVSSMALFAETRFGGAKRLYYLARELDRRAELDLLCFDGCREWDEAAAQRPEFRNRLALDLGGRKGFFRRVFSLPVDSAEAVTRHQSALQGFLGGRRYDATLFAYPIALSLLGRRWDAGFGRKLYLEDDLLLETYLRNAQVTQAPLAERLKGRWRRRQGVAYFRKKLQGFTGFACISREEEDVVRGLFPGLPTRVLQYGLPLEDYPALPAPQAGRTLGFIGNYRHLPNLDALRWLVDEIFPCIQGSLQDTRLVIGGRFIPGDVKAKAAGRPIVFREDVADLGDFYREVSLFINPIREGRGLRTKVVEAAAFGRPVLTTALGAEGLQALPLKVCETKEDFLAAVRSFSEPGAYARAAAEGRRAVETGFSLSAVGERLLQALS